jgi:alkylation response protein AidB-like acyl-CoA dehydrogenase
MVDATILDTSDYRAHVRAFLAEHLPAGWAGIGALDEHEAHAFLVGWRRTLHDHGFLGITWPTEYGGQGRSKHDQIVLTEELARAGVPGGVPNDTFGVKMLGNTLLRWGTEEQRRHFLPRILRGDDVWCQGYSEPNAGSDLASLGTRARLDGDQWTLAGQKVWTSNAHLANWIFVLARTNADAPPHRGISFLLVPLNQPGVEIRPIPMMSGQLEFNEVFFDGARTAADNVVGPVDEGWRVAMTLLGHERGEEAATNPVMFRAELDRLIRLARDRGRLDDPLVRDRLADCYTRVEVMRHMGLRITTDYLREGTLGAAASISKLYWSEYHRRVTSLALDILGPHALVPEGRRPPRAYRTDDPGAPNSTSSWVGVFYNSIAGTIYAGTSQVQRNILGESILGLPKEPRP